MRVYAPGLVAILILLALTVSGASALSGPGTVSVQSLRLYQQETDAGTLQVFQIKNPRITSNAIGNAELLCTVIGGRAGPLPPHARFCWGSYSIGSSSIQVAGVARTPFLFQLAVIGGGGDYQNVGGMLTVFRFSESPIRERLVFKLTT